MQKAKKVRKEYKISQYTYINPINAVQGRVWVKCRKKANGVRAIHPFGNHAITFPVLPGIVQEEKGI